MAIEIVDLPIKNCGFSINHPFIDGFSIAKPSSHFFNGIFVGIFPYIGLKKMVGTSNKSDPQIPIDLFQWEFQIYFNGNFRILKWRYLAYIRPIFQAYVSFKQNQKATPLLL